MKKNKIIFALFAFMILLFAFQRVYSLAYLNQTTNPVINLFASSTFDITVHEDFTDGDSVKENVKIQNTGNVPMYVRVKILVQAQEENGVIIANPIAVDDFNYRGIDIDDFEISKTDNWIKIGEYYYYKELIDPNKEVLLFESACLKENIVFKEKYVPVLTISAQGVQANAIKLENVWNEIKIDEKNELVPSVED